MTGPEIQKFIRLYDACFPLHRLSRDSRHAFEVYLSEFDANRVRAAFDLLMNEANAFPPTLREIRGRCIDIAETPEYLRLPAAVDRVPSEEEQIEGRRRIAEIVSSLAKSHSLPGLDREAP